MPKMNGAGESIGIRPIVDRPIVVIRLVTRTIIAVLTMVAPDMAVRAEIGGVRRAGAVSAPAAPRRPYRSQPARQPRERRRTGCTDKLFMTGLLLVDPRCEINGRQSRPFQGTPQIRNRPAMSGPVDVCARLSLLPAAPVAMMAVMVVATMMMVPAVPTAVMAMMPPVHFRRRQLCVLLNRRGGAGIAERHRIGALGRRCEREQRADGGESQNLSKTA